MKQQSATTPGIQLGVALCSLLVFAEVRMSLRNEERDKYRNL
jgi:hypothetical protein